MKQLLELIRARPWALHPDTLSALVRMATSTPTVRATWAAGTGGEQAQAPAVATSGVLTSTQRAAAGNTSTDWRIAVLPLQGVLMHRASWWGTGLEAWREEFKGLLANPSVTGIVIPVDSPGGSVFGCEEAGEDVFRARGVKPVVAMGNPMAASAAYWIASQAERVVMTPSGIAGSIGVWTGHTDESRFWDEAGFTITLIKAGKYKIEANPWEPLTDEAKDAIQDDVDRAYVKFVDAVARGRGVTTKVVEAKFGQGRTLDSQEALAVGMVDAIGVMDDAVAQVVTLAGRKTESTATRRTGRAEEPDQVEPQAAETTTPAPATAGEATAEDLATAPTAEDPAAADPPQATTPAVAGAGPPPPPPPGPRAPGRAAAAAHDPAPPTPEEPVTPSAGSGGVTEPSLHREWLSLEQLRRRREG